MKILAIDDNQDNLISIQALITEVFPEAIMLTALDGFKGLELAASEDPDIILLDILMPVMDGLTVCKKLKADETLCEIPVVFVTAQRDDKESRIRALECGAEAFLTKPIDESELTAQIRAMVKIKSAIIQKRNENARLTELVELQTCKLRQTHSTTLMLLDDLKKEVESRKKSEETLRESEEKHRQLAHEQWIILNSTSVGITFVKNRKVVWTNPAFDKLFGYELGTTQDMESVEFYAAYASYEQFGIKAYESIDSGLIYSQEVLMKKKNGSSIWCNLVGQAITPGNRSDGSIWIVQDISERKQAEEEKSKLEVQLQQAQKMESVGRLAGGVAHDFNNMLGVILGYVHLAFSELEPTHKLHAYLTEIHKSAERSVELTKQLLAFARKQTIAPKVLDLNQTVEGMLKMLQRLIGEDIKLDWKPAAELWPVKLDPSQVDQLLANLCVNARDAISGVGIITIETGICFPDESFCSRCDVCIPGKYVRLIVNDNGCGMSSETAAQIFEPFFTTKGVGLGTGLGLSTVYGIVKQNNGFINVSSELGKGTLFSIFLPCYKGDTDQTQIGSVLEAAPRGRETILLVEDEKSILKVTQKLLTLQGYTVLEANTPVDAFRHTKEHYGEIHLLLTDVVMPEMNGRDLAAHLVSLYPRLKCLFMSGYTADVIAQNGVLEDGVHFIQKPFTMPDLAFKVREVLDI